MKIPCEIKGKPAVVVGYSSSRKGPQAIVVFEGKLTAVRLRDVVLGELPEQLSSKPKLREVAK